MQKFILMSIVFMLIALPIRAAGERNPRLALKRVIWWSVAGIGFYVFLLLWVYPRYVG